MKYTKKFANVNEADGLVIPNPFIGHVENGQMIANSEDGKKLKLEGGQLVVEDAVMLITFYIGSDTYQAVSGWTWEDLFEYSGEDYPAAYACKIGDDGYVSSSADATEFIWTEEDWQNRTPEKRVPATDQIIANFHYYWD